MIEWMVPISLILLGISSIYSSLSMRRLLKRIEQLEAVCRELNPGADI